MSLYGGLYGTSSGTSGGSSATGQEIPKEEPKPASSSLVFAPIRRAQPAVKPKARPAGFVSAAFQSQEVTPSAAVPSASGSAYGFSSASSTQEAGSIFNRPGLGVLPPATATAPLSNINASTSTSTSRPLPLLTLEDDVNGFNKRSKKGNGGGGGGKRRKGQAQNATFDPYEMYDPSRPNDLSEFKKFREIEKREKRERERERAAQSDSYSDYSDEEADSKKQPMNRGAGFFPPPSVYTDAPSVPPPTESIAPRQESGEEAFLRRQALSRPPVAGGPSNFAPPPSFVQPPPAQPPPPTLYAPQPPQPPQAPFVETPASAPLDQAAFQAKLAETRNKAAEIAARFAKAVPPSSASSTVSQPPTTSDSEPKEPQDKSKFAQRMMDKWGHVKGTGLGVNGSGISKALSVKKTFTKGDQSQRATGKVISETSTRQAAIDKERWGEPSRVVVLEKLVGSMEEVDDELSGEVGGECEQYGGVERVILHTVYPAPPDPSDCLKVFVCFVGPVGAWTAVRGLDGRLFGGREVKARYYNEALFQQGELNG